jgi:hypothetical protein
MTTNYRMTDSLPKDLSGARILAPIDDSTSQLDFLMLTGIGVRSMGATSRNLGHLAVGSHTIGSAIDKGVGTVILGVYTESPSAVGINNAVGLRSDSLGNQYVRSASNTMSVSSASVETHVTGSALLTDVHAVFSDSNAGDSLTIEDGDNYRLTFIVTSASQHFSEHFSAGLYFGTNIKSTFTFSGAGAGSITVAYSQN